MADRVSGNLRRSISLAGIALLAGMCTACTGMGDPAGFSIVTQDMMDFKTCPEIVSLRSSLVNREKELVGLVAKADASPGGIIVSYTAYRTELTSTRAQLRAADRAVQMKGCK
jgi:hypothetical protein